MTKEAYFEMCEALGSEPLDDEIPVEIDDFPLLVQDCLVLYSMLADRWDSMGGQYLGKDYSIVFNLFTVYQIQETEEQMLCLSFIQKIDAIRSEIINSKIKAKTSQK